MPCSRRSRAVYLIRAGLRQTKLRASVNRERTAAVDLEENLTNPVRTGGCSAEADPRMERCFRQLSGQERPHGSVASGVGISSENDS